MKTNHILLFLIFLLTSSSADAVGILGGDIEYKLTGRDTVKVTLRLYRNCARTDTFPSAYTCYIKKVSCNTNDTGTLTLNRVATSPVKITCETQASRCENSTFPYGVQVHQYEATAALNSIFASGLDSNCCRLLVYFSQCCRDSGITNMTPAVSPFYIEAEFNRCLAPGNTSPKITRDPFFLLCNGQPFYYNHGFRDSTDHDSVSSVIANPISTGYSLSYVSSYNINRPLQFLGFPNNTLPTPAGFHYNNVTGQGMFTSTAIQKPLLCYRIDEWRKINGTYQKIGSTYREFINQTYQCPPDNPPTAKVDGFSLLTGTPLFRVCANRNICLNIKSEDRDSTSNFGPDTTTLSWNKGIPWGTFNSANTPQRTIREDTATFCWTPQSHHASSLPYYFVIQVENQDCPVPRRNTYSVGVIVGGGFSTYQQNITSAGFMRYTLKAIKTNPALPSASTINWQVSSTPGAFKNPIQYASDSLVHKFDSAGSYVVRLTCTSPDNRCNEIHVDTIHIPCNLKVSLDSSFDAGYCKGTTGSYARIKVENNIGPTVYKWYAMNLQTQQTTLIDSGNVFTNFTKTQAGHWRIKGSARDSVCVREAYVYSYVLDQPVAGFTATPLSGHSPLNVTFTNTTTGAFNQALGTFENTSPQTSGTLTSIGQYSFWLKVINRDSAGNMCSDSIYKSNYIRVKPPCTIKPRISQRQLVECMRADSFLITANVDSAQGNILYLWEVIDTKTQQSTQHSSNSFLLPLNTATTYKIVLKTTDSVCTVADSVTAIILPNPSANFTADKTTGVTPLTVKLTCSSTGIKQYLWNNGDTTFLSTRSFSTLGFHSVWLKVTAKDTLGKTCTDSVYKQNYIRVKPPCTIKPYINQRQTIVCAQSGNAIFSATIDSAQGYPLYLWTATNMATQQTATSTANGLFVPTQIPGTYKIKLQASDTACSVIDSTVAIILRKPVANFTATPVSGIAPTIIQFNNTSVFAEKFKWSFGDTTANPSRIFNFAGVYDIWLSVQTKDSLGLRCRDSVFKTAFITISPATGLEETIGNSVSIEPNPSKGLIHIKNAASGSKYTVYNSIGKQILTGKTENNVSEKIYVTASGVCILILQTPDGHIYQFKLIVE